MGHNYEKNVWWSYDSFHTSWGDDNSYLNIKVDTLWNKEVRVKKYNYILRKMI